MVTPVKSGLVGLALLAAALSNQNVKGTLSHSADRLGRAVSSISESIGDYDMFGSDATKKYRREPHTLEIMSTPLELSDDNKNDKKTTTNQFVAEYIRRQAIAQGVDVPSVKDYIHSGIKIYTLQSDPNGTPGLQLMAELGASQRNKPSQ